jgi:putative transposase
MTKSTVLRKTYRFQLRPTKRQVRSLNSALAICCELYNAALQERREAWKSARKTVGYCGQTKELTEVRQIRPDVAALPVDMAREPIRRVDRAFQGFFRRCKEGQKPGYPRFRSRDRYDSLACSAPDFRVDSGRVVVSKLGGFRMRMHREMNGMPKHCTIKRLGKRWQVMIVCELGPAPDKKPVSSVVGIDLGVRTFAVLSDGKTIEQPNWAKRSEDLIARKQRELAAKKRGSNNRRKAREGLRRAQERVANRRNNFCHHVSKWLVASYDLVAFEKLNIRAMTEGFMAKSIMQAAWGILLWQIAYKAESAGRYAVAVNPKGTTQRCSGCGAIVPKGLSQRIHLCPDCGLVLDRDHNAAINIVRLGRSAVGLPPPRGLAT